MDDFNKVQDMFDKAKREIAEVWGTPEVLDLPLHIFSFAGTKWEDANAFTDFIPFLGLPFRVAFDTGRLLEMDEDEVRYGLLHELTHATLPMDTPSHGEEFVDRVFYTTGVAAPWIALRRDHEGENLDNPPTVADFPGWPEGY